MVSGGVTWHPPYDEKGNPITTLPGYSNPYNGITTQNPANVAGNGITLGPKPEDIMSGGVITSGMTAATNTSGNLSDIAGDYGNLKCKDAANAMSKYLEKQNKDFKYLTMSFSNNGYIISLTKEVQYGLDHKKAQISENGRHYAIEYNGIVYCNVHPYGLPRKVWEADFIGGGVKTVTSF